MTNPIRKLLADLPEKGTVIITAEMVTNIITYFKESGVDCNEDLVSDFLHYLNRSGVVGINTLATTSDSQPIFTITKTYNGN